MKLYIIENSLGREIYFVCSSLENVIKEWNKYHKDDDCFKIRRIELIDSSVIIGE